MIKFRRRIASQEVYKIDKEYEDFEVNENFSQIEIKAYEDLNGDSLPDTINISEVCGGGHEKLNFTISNLIVNQKYILHFDEWSNAMANPSATEMWMYGCAISPKIIIDTEPGKKVLEGLPMWDCSNNIGGYHTGVQIAFTATAETMYWVWDFGRLKDLLGFTHKLTNINLTLVPPTFNLNSMVNLLGTGTYEKIEAVNNDHVKFNFTGASGVECIYYPITNLAANRTYRFTFSECYHGNLIQDSYQYGCTITSVLPTNFENKKVINALAEFTAVNTSGIREATFSFKPTTSAGYWIWDFGRLSDRVKNENTFTIIKLEILAPDGTYKTLIE